MNVNDSRMIIYPLWVLVFPLVMWLLSTNVEVKISGYELELISYLLVTAFLSILTFTVTRIPNYLFEPLSIVVFLYYGLIVDIVFIQAVLIGLFVSLTSIIKLYDTSKRVNEDLQKTSELGSLILEHLKINPVVDLFLKKTGEIIPFDCLYMIEVVDENKVRLLRSMENHQAQSPNHELSIINAEITAQIISSELPLLFQSKREWVKMQERYLPGNVESMIAVPIMKREKVEMVVIFTSSKKRTFKNHHLRLVLLLASFLGTAIENAHYYITTKNRSERCPLTHIYNYRYFEKILKKEFNKLNPSLEHTTPSPLSLILIDIDHFKTINDTYGHQSGNEILVELSARLVDVIGEIGTVARYGGEEFVILLPDTDRFTCYSIAETVRQMIANRPFSLQDDLKDSGKEVLVRITASVGVATAPDDAEDALDLVRHADRAMYTGAKQAGRNRVAEYVK